jgi:hypothetical protein
LSDPAAGTLSTGTSGAVTSSFGAGVWTASGAVGNVNSLLAGVVFTPAAGYSSDFTIAVTVDDGTAAPVTGVKSVAIATTSSPPSPPPVPEEPPPPIPIDTPDPEDLAEPEPPAPPEDPTPPTEEEPAAEEESSSEAEAADPPNAAAQAPANAQPQQGSLIGNSFRQAGDSPPRSFTFENGLGFDSTDIQRAPSDTQSAWYEMGPRIPIGNPQLQGNAFEILTARAFESLKSSLDDLKKETHGELEFNRAVLSSAIAVTTGLSMGYVAWLLRSGVLLSSLLSAMPAWRFLDPLPILAGRKEGEEEDEETLESIIENGSGPGNGNDKDDLPSTGTPENE